MAARNLSAQAGAGRGARAYDRPDLNSCLGYGLAAAGPIERLVQFEYAILVPQYWEVLVRAGTTYSISWAITGVRPAVSEASPAPQTSKVRDRLSQQQAENRTKQGPYEQ